MDPGLVDAEQTPVLGTSGWVEQLDPCHHRPAGHLKAEGAEGEEGSRVNCRELA